MEHFFPEFRWRQKNWEDKKKVFTKNGEDQKKRKKIMERFFPPNSGKDLHSDAHQSQIMGGIQSTYWGDISPSRVSAPLHTAITLKIGTVEGGNRKLKLNGVRLNAWNNSWSNFAGCRSRDTSFTFPDLKSWF